MATIVLPDNGQRFPIDDAIARSDEMLRQALAIVYPGVANADIRREDKNGELVITIIKQAGRKGVTNSFDCHSVCDAAPSSSPVTAQPLPQTEQAASACANPTIPIFNSTAIEEGGIFTIEEADPALLPHTDEPPVVVAMLRQTIEEINPALALTWRLKELERQTRPLDLTIWLAQQTEIRKALRAGTAEKEQIDRIVQTLKRLPPVPSTTVPLGF